MDFVNEPVEVTFPPSNGVAQMIATINFMDDIVNESQEGFLLVLDIVSSDPLDDITLTRSVSLVRITDNDRKCMMRASVFKIL